MDRFIGIWLNADYALIVTLEGEEELMHRIESEVEHYHVHGGSRSAGTPWGPQDARPEGKLMERKMHQLHKYYLSIIDYLQETDKLYVMGPAEAKIGLVKTLNHHPIWRKKTIIAEPAQQMTERQLKARIREVRNAITNLVRPMAYA